MDSGICAECDCIKQSGNVTGIQIAYLPGSNCSESVSRDCIKLSSNVYSAHLHINGCYWILCQGQHTIMMPYHLKIYENYNV